MRPVSSFTVFLAISMLSGVAYGQSPFKANPFSPGGSESTSEKSNPSSAKTTTDSAADIKKVKNPFFSENAERETGIDRKALSEPSRPSQPSQARQQSSNEIRSLNEKDNLISGTLPRAMTGADSSTADLSVARKPEAIRDDKPQLFPAKRDLQDGISQMTLQQVNQHLEYGKALARRGAAGSAKQEFLAALAVLAQANDAHAGSNIHSESLRRGLNALDESRDFMLTQPEKQIGRSVQEVVRGHRTDLFNDQTAEQTTSIEALRRYLFHAKQQLEFAAGSNPLAGHTLFCLGKLQTAQASAHPSQDIVSRTQGIIFHSTALSCDTRNYQSAHELGVLLARSGEWSKSRQMLERSLRIQQTPEAWKNLAVVNQNLNQTELAQKANAEYQRMLADQSGRSIQWMNPKEFAQTNPVEFGETQFSNSQVQPEKSPPPDRMGKVESTEKPSIGSRIKGIF